MALAQRDQSGNERDFPIIVLLFLHNHWRATPPSRERAGEEGKERTHGRASFRVEDCSGVKAKTWRQCGDGMAWLWLDVGEGRGRLDWVGQVGFGGLKLMASIVAVSAVRVLGLPGRGASERPRPGLARGRSPWLRRFRRAACAHGPDFAPGPPSFARGLGAGRRNAAIEGAPSLMQSCAGPRRPNPDQPEKEGALPNVAQAEPAHGWMWCWMWDRARVPASSGLART